jgi:hypothetical protein
LQQASLNHAQGYVEQLQAGHEARQRERINGELGDGFIGVGIGL